jgi:hypothetical protein
MILTLDPLVDVDRAISELRRSAVVRVYNEHVSFLMMAVDALTAEYLDAFIQSSSALPQLAITGTRAKVLGIEQSERPVSLISHPDGLSQDLIEYLANPLTAAMTMPSLTGLVVGDAHSVAQACVKLSKLSRLLPAALIVNIIDSSKFNDLPAVQVESIESYMTTAANSLKQVSDARVPLENAENARVVAFRPRDGGIEHLAIIIGEIDPTEPVLVRLHSECFTGDLIGSLRCDCGNQLRGAIGEMALNGRVTRDVYNAENNQDTRAAWYEILGQEKMMGILEVVEIDRGTFVHNDASIEEVVLFKTKKSYPETGDNPYAWVRFICPSTGTNYLIDVEPHHTSAVEAAVSTSPLVTSVDDYKFDDRA